MPLAVDITGQRFGRLTAMYHRPYVGACGKGREWVCRCDCGGEASARTSQLRDGSNTNCGCRRAGNNGECKTCGKEIRRKKSKRVRFCSHDCYWKDRIGRGTENWNFGKGGYTTKGKGKKRGPRPSAASIKQKAWWEVRRGQPRTTRLYTKGASHHNWKGGSYGSERHRIMTSAEYKRLVFNVFKRDGFTCIKCGKIGDYMHMDHIKSWSEHPELRLEPTNCRTLCRGCHYFVTYGRPMPADSRWGIPISLSKKAR